MAAVYSAVHSNQSSPRQVFSETVDALVILTNTDTGALDVIAVVRDLTTAQTICTALNGA